MQVTLLVHTSQIKTPTEALAVDLQSGLILVAENFEEYVFSK